MGSVGERPERTQQGASRAGDPGAAPAALDVAELTRLITRELARMCHRPVAEVDPDRPFDELGLASRDAVALAGYLESVTGRPLPPTLVWDFPTVSLLASALSSSAQTAGPAPLVHRAASSPPPRLDDPVAVIGIGCRFPGGPAGSLGGPGEFWDFLCGGCDAITEVDPGRWAAFDDGSAATGEVLASVTRWAGTLSDIAGFDAAFFGIAPGEAAAMDPQQRILLEVCWEALEHAGLPPRSLRGSRTGVFAGISAAEYAHMTTSDLSRVDAWTATGAAASVAAGRISYLLDLRGPSMAVDTACSSSLLAVHLAVASLRSGESDLALAGGVNLLLSPVITMTFDAGGGTSPDGRCRPFDAAANGMVRGEGCGVVVLKRLTAARRDGDRVLAVITGTAANSDGRSNGLVAPSASAQRDLLRTAYTTAGIRPDQVDYVEAHGTGTPLGDPIEARALAGVLGTARPPDRPLLIGSVKSNIGHLEVAAGMAGLIKTVLALSHRQIPPTLHFTGPAPQLPLAGLGLSVVSDLTGWPDNPWLPTAGVSAFGFSGTNVHVVLTAGPLPEDDAQAASQAEGGPPGVPGGRRGPSGGRRIVPSGDALADSEAASCPLMFPLTDLSAERVREHAVRLADWLDGGAAAGDPPLAHIASTLAARQGRGPHRAVVVTGDRGELLSALRSLGAGQPHAAVVSGQAGKRTSQVPPEAAPGQDGPGVAFVFSGYGSQWADMGLALAASEPVFAEALAEAEELIASASGLSVSRLVRDATAMRQVQYAQPVLFGVQLALARLWQAHGIQPRAVIGHSMGEIAAAVVSGSLSPADGAHVIICRSRLLSRLAGSGTMALVGLPADEVTGLATGLPGVHLAVISSPAQCVVTGDSEQVDELARRVTACDASIRVLPAEGAGHSPQVDPLLGELAAQLDGIRGRTGRIRFYSTAHDDPRTPPACDPAYWAVNVRQPVKLGPAVAAAAADGLRGFVEISPHPMLTRALAETVHHETGADGIITGTLRRDAADGQAFHLQLARLAAGLRQPASHPRTIIDLPPAPWQHVRHWAGRSRRPAQSGHPLLGSHVELPGGTRHAWQSTLTPDTLSALTVPGPTASLFPLSAAAEMAVAAACEAWSIPAQALTITAVKLTRLTPVSSGTLLAATLDETGASAGRHATIQLHTREQSGPWHLTATAEATETGPAGLAGWPQGDRRTVAVPPARLARGQYVPAGVLAGCLAAVCEAGQVPVAIGRLRLPGPAAGGGQCEVVRDDQGDDVDLRLTAGSDGVVLDVTGVRVAEVPAADVPVPYRDKLFERGWRELDAPEAPGLATRSWVVLGVPAAAAAHVTALAGELVACLEAAGHQASVVTTMADPGDHAELAGVVLLLPPEAPDAAGAERLVLDVIQAAVILAGRSGPTPRLWMVTAGAAAVRPGDTGKPGLAALRGLVRVLALERPGLRATLADLDPDAGPGEAAAALAAELMADPGEDELAWRDGARLVARLVRPQTGSAAVELRGRGAHRPVRRGRVVQAGAAYIVTGGYGALGLVVARWLAERGAGRIVLNGRNGPSADARAVLDALDAMGGRIVVVTGDVAEAGVAERLVGAACRGGMALRGVVHAAGQPADALIGDVTSGGMDRVWMPKVAGAWRLHEAIEGANGNATGGTGLDWFVLFSSAAALLGSPGQAAYATANAWLDAFAAWRRAQRLPAMAINWGLWSVGGQGAGTALRGLGMIGPDEGAAALEQAIMDGWTAAGVVRLDPAQAAAAYPEIGALPYFAALTGGDAAVGSCSGKESRAHAGLGDWPGPAALRATEPVRRCQLAGQRVLMQVAAVIGVPPERVSGDLPLTDAGADSLAAQRICNLLEHDLGVTIEPAALLGGATLTQLRETVAAELGVPSDARSAAAGRPGGEERSAAGALAGVEPRDAAERLVARVVAEVLGVMPGMTDDLRAVGLPGTVRELIAQKLVAEIGTHIDSAGLFAIPTIEAAADVVRSADEAEVAGIVRLIRAGGTRPPVLLAHPAGGTTGVYKALASMLGGERAVFGLERLEGALTERAARYAEAIPGRFPGGGWVLGGWSFGGVLGYETARQLAAAGHRVAQVVLFDAALPLPIPAGTEGEVLARRFAAFAGYLTATYRREVRLSADELLGLAEEAQLSLLTERMSAAGLTEVLSPAILRHQLKSHQDTQTLERYQPERYDGPVVLYRADRETPWAVRDQRYEITSESRGWDALCASLAVVPVDCHHLNVLDPPAVHTVAAHLRALLSSQGGIL